MSLLRQSRFPSFRPALLLLAAAASVGGMDSASAATQTWTGATSTAFTTAGNWNTGVPTAADTALWNASSTANLGISLASPQAVLGLRLTSPSSAVSLGGSTLALGSGGIDMAAATQNLSITSNLSLGGGQEWNVTTSQTLALTTGTFNRAVGTALSLPGAGSVTSSMAGLANSNSILGPWARTGTGATTRYATLTSGSIVGFAGATAAAAFGWPSGNNNTFNYDVAAVQGNLGVGRQANTARYTGTAGTQNWGNNNTTTITLNGLMNMGTGVLTFGEAGGTNQGQLAVGTNNSNELVLSPITSGITITIPIINTGANAGAVTVAGPGTVNITSAGGISTYTGRTTVAAGTLLMSGGGNINTSSGLTIDGPTARYVHTSSVASTLPVTLTSGTLDGTGSVGAVTVGNGLGGVVTNGNGGTGALTLSSLSFSGVGTATVNSVGSAGLVVTGALSTSGIDGQVTINAAGTFVNGTTNLISYGSFAAPDINDFALGTVTGASPRAIKSLVLSGNNVALALNSESVVWSGTGTGLWQTGVTGTVGANPNWALSTSQTPTDFWAADNAQFNDTVTVSGSTYAPVSLVTIAGGNVSPTTTVFTNSAVNYTITSSDGSGIGAGSVTKNGSASVTISSSNSYAGGTVLNAGTLNVQNSSAVGTGVVTITGGTLGNSSGAAVTLSTNNAQTWSGDVAFAGPDALNMGTGLVTLGGSGSRTVTVPSGTFTVGRLSGTSVSGTIGLTKAGAGTLTLNPTAPSSIGDLLVADGTLNIGAQDLVTTGLTGSGTIANGSATTRWLVVNSATDSTFSGLLTDGAGGGRLGLFKQGAGTLTVAGSNSYSDTTTIGVAQGPAVIRAAATNALGTGLIDFDLTGNASTARLELAGGITLANSAVTLRGRNNSSVAILNVSGSNTLNAPISITIGGGTYIFQSDSGTLNLGGAISATGGARLLQVTGSGDGILGGAISNGGGTIAIAKSGTGTWTLSGNSTYTGTTAVLGGTLLVNGDNSAAAGAVTVAGGSLGGIGRLGGAITVATGGTIIPGAGIGTLTGTQSLSFTDGSTLGSELNSASVLGDLLAVGTDLNLAGTVTLTLTDLSASTPITPGTILSLVNYGGSWNGGLLTYSGSALADEDLFTFGVNQFRIDYNSTTPGVNVTSPVGASYVNLVAVPEPTVSVALLSTLGLAALVLRRRRG